MKNIIELMEASKDDLPEIYCDMDQVLCDFMKGADKALGSPFVQADRKTRWNKIAQTKDFWANLSWMPGAKRLYSFISKYDPHILSAYSGRDDSSRRGKLKWLDKNTKFKRSNINLVKRADKKNFATTNGKPNVLVDDYLKNINEWESAGGTGVHHTEVGKTVAKLKSLGFK
jgi:hypothetical protein